MLEILYACIITANKNIYKLNHYYKNTFFIYQKASNAALSIQKTLYFSLTNANLGKAFAKINMY